MKGAAHRSPFIITTLHAHHFTYIIGALLCLAVSTPEDGRFIYVYRLAIDARTSMVDSVTGRKYPSLLEDFQTAAASMAHKRHLASTARGFLLFLSYSNHMTICCTWRSAA